MSPTRLHCHGFSQARILGSHFLLQGTQMFSFHEPPAAPSAGAPAPLPNHGIQGPASPTQSSASLHNTSSSLAQPPWAPAPPACSPSLGLKASTTCCPWPLSKLLLLSLHLVTRSNSQAPPALGVTRARRPRSPGSSTRAHGRLQRGCKEVSISRRCELPQSRVGNPGSFQNLLWRPDPSETASLQS